MLRRSLIRNNCMLKNRFLYLHIYIYIYIEYYDFLYTLYTLYYVSHIFKYHV